MTENGPWHSLTSEQDNKKHGRPSQTDVIFVVMDALGSVFVSEILILHYHVRVVTVKSPMSAFQSAHAFLSCSILLVVDNLNAHAFRLSYSNRPVAANQNIHASCLSSFLAKQKMRVKYAKSWMMASIYQRSTPGLQFSECSASWHPRYCPLWPSTSQVTRPDWRITWSWGATMGLLTSSGSE